MSTAKRILLVEDDDIDAEGVLRTLGAGSSEKGSTTYDVRHVSTLTGGLQALDQEAFDLILLDMGLPDASGIESFEKVNTLTPHTPIVMLTGSQDEELALEVVRSGAQDFLVKGANMRQELARCVNYAIERHRLKGELAETVLALHHKSSILQSVIDHMGDGVVVTDENGVIKIFNPAAAEILASKLGLHSSFKGEAEALSKKTIEAVLRGEEINGEEFFLTTPLHPEGRFLSVTARPINDPKNALNGCVTVLHDITKRRKLEELKDEFVSMVSHELRTPLTSINGSLGLLLTDIVDVLPPETKALIEIAHRNSDRLVRLIGDILDIQKLESGKMKMEMTPLEVTKLIQQAVDGNQGYAEKHGITIQYHNNSPEEIWVQGDSDRMLQVMANLLSNAVKFSPEGGNVEVGVLLENENVKVSIRDQGVGIPEVFQQKIFQKFAQAGGEANKKKGGTGLGLNISQSIVALHGGRIWFETAAGKGTVFLFTLPVIQAAQQAEIQHIASSDPSY